MAVLDLRFCARGFSSCGKWGPLFIAVRGPLTIAASLAAEHRLQTCRLSNCGSRAQSLRGMWDLPRPGLEPVSSAMAGRFSTTAPPGKPSVVLLVTKISQNLGCNNKSVKMVFAGREDRVTQLGPHLTFEVNTRWQHSGGILCIRPDGLLSPYSPPPKKKKTSETVRASIFLPLKWGQQY